MNKTANSYEAPDMKILSLEGQGAFAVSPNADPSAPGNWGWEDEHEI